MGTVFMKDFIHDIRTDRKREKADYKAKGYSVSSNYKCLAKVDVKPLEMIWVSHSEALHKFQPGRPYLSYGYLGSNSAVFMRDSQDLFYATNIYSVKYSDLEKGFEKRIGSYDGNAVWGYAVPWQNNRIVGCGESNRLLVQNSETGEEDYEVDYYPGINVFGCDFRKAKLEELSEMKVRVGGGII